MGQCYAHEQLNMDEAAIRCYQRAHDSDDREGAPFNSTPFMWLIHTMSCYAELSDQPQMAIGKATGAHSGRAQEWAGSMWIIQGTLSRDSHAVHAQHRSDMQLRSGQRCAGAECGVCGDGDMGRQHETQILECLQLLLCTGLSRRMSGAGMLRSHVSCG